MCGKTGDWRGIFMRISEDCEIDTPEGEAEQMKNLLEKQLQK